MAKNRKKVFRRKVILKIIVISLLLLLLIPMIITGGMVLGEMFGAEKKDRAEAISSCNFKYYQGDYADLRETLDLNGIPKGDPDFIKYEEMADAYVIWQKWDAYLAALRTDDLSEQERSADEARAAQLEKELRDALAAATDPDNQRIMKDLIEQTKAAAGN